MPAAHRRVIFWRHGRTAWNVEGRFQGSTDIPLDSTGIAQAERSAAVLARIPIDAVVSSNLSRAVATAAPFSRRTGLPVTIDADLRETGGGSWEGLTQAEIRERDGDALDHWAAGLTEIHPPGGETRHDVARRATAAVERHLQDIPPGGALLVVTHGGALRATVGSMIGLPTDAWSALGVLNNCSWSVIGEANPAHQDASVSRRAWRLFEYNVSPLMAAHDLDGS